MVPFRKRVKIPQQNGTISEKGQNSSSKILPFQKSLKFIDKEDTISEKGQNSSTKMVPFLKRVKIPQQQWYNFSQKRVKIP